MNAPSPSPASSPGTYTLRSNRSARGLSDRKGFASVSQSHSTPAPAPPPASAAAAGVVIALSASSSLSASFTVYPVTTSGHLCAWTILSIVGLHSSCEYPHIPALNATASSGTHPEKVLAVDAFLSAGASASSSSSSSYSPSDAMSWYSPT